MDEDGTVVNCCLTVAIAELSRREKAKDGNGDEGDEAGVVSGFRARD